MKLADNTPLSVFTIGIESDCDTLLDFLTDPNPGFHSHGDWSKEITDLFTRFYSNPGLDWKDEINALQYRIGGYSVDSDCFDPNNRLGTINELYSPPNYKRVYTYTPEMLQKIPEPLRTHIINTLTHPGQSTYVTSSLKDFILKYTVTVEQ